MCIRDRIENELMTEQIPKNMIQPLVENALFHGLIDEESGEPVSYTHLDVYKRQTDGNTMVILFSSSGKSLYVLKSLEMCIRDSANSYRVIS